LAAQNLAVRVAPIDRARSTRDRRALSSVHLDNGLVHSPLHRQNEGSVFKDFSDIVGPASRSGASIYCFIERTWLASWIPSVTGNLDIIKQEAVERRAGVIFDSPAGLRQRIRQ